MLTDDYFIGTKLYHKKFIELCKPITNYLGATHAIYVWVDKHGKMFSVCSHPKWVERFLEEQYYKLDPLMVCPTNIHNGFSFDDAYGDQEFKDNLLYDAVTQFNWCNSFAYIEKTSDGGYFGFDFGTTKDNYHITNRLINEAPIVRKYIRSLNKTLRLAIKDLEEHTVDFAAMKGELFYTQKGLVFNEQRENHYKLQLLKDTGLLINDDDDHFLANVLLSPQEINCLRLYHETHSLKKVSQDLNLAVTTVTSYIENIKNKLRCNTKNELYEKAEILGSLGRI